MDITNFRVRKHPNKTNRRTKLIPDLQAKCILPDLLDLKSQNIDTCWPYKFPEVIKGPLHVLLHILLFVLASFKPKFWGDTIRAGVLVLVQNKKRKRHKFLQIDIYCTYRIWGDYFKSSQMNPPLYIRGKCYKCIQRFSCQLFMLLWLSKMTPH